MYWIKVKITANDIFAIHSSRMYSYNTTGTNLLNFVFDAGGNKEIELQVTVNAGKHEEVLKCIHDATKGTNASRWMESPFILIMDKVTGYKICPDITDVAINKREI